MTVLYKLKSHSHTAAFQPISSGGKKPHYSKDERVASKCLLLFGVAMQHIKKNRPFCHMATRQAFFLEKRGHNFFTAVTYSFECNKPFWEVYLTNFFQTQALLF